MPATNDRSINHVNRRDGIIALCALGLAVGSPYARSQGRQRNVPARVAILDDAPEATRAHLWASFRRRLKDLGYADGREITFEQRWAGGNLEKLDQLSAELVARNPDVIVAVTTTAALAAKKATSRIPIVALGPADPVRSGLVMSLGRPGGNVTGVSPNQSEIAGKWLEIVLEIVPRAKSLAYLTDRGNPGEMLVFRELQERARPLGLDVRAMDGLTKSDVEQTYASIERDRVDAIIVATTASLVAHRHQIVEAAARLRIPVVYARKDYPEVGGLLSYGTDPETVFVRGADHVDRILKGTHPSELPFEMASTFTLVVNMKTLRALGVKMPQSVLARADRLIE